MKRIGIITLFAALFCFMASAAMAYTIFGVPVNPGDKLQFSFYDAEIGPLPTSIAVGDTFSGIFAVDSITDVTTNKTYGAQVNGCCTIVGNFTYTVSKVYTSNVTIGGVTYYNVPSYDLSDDLNIYYNSAGTGISSAAVYNSTIYSGTTDISAYCNPGKLIATFNGTITAYGLGLTIQIGTLTNPEPINLVNNYTGVLWGPWGMVSTISANGYYSTTHWIYCSKDPLSTTYKQPIPEPATIMLLGAGLLGLGSWGRKKTKKDKES